MLRMQTAPEPRAPPPFTTMAMAPTAMAPRDAAPGSPANPVKAVRKAARGALDATDAAKGAVDAAASQPLPPPDSYMDRLVKLIPAEVLTAWVALNALLEGMGAAQAPKWGRQSTFLILLALAFILVAASAKWEHHRLEVPWLEAFLAMAAFALWVFSMQQWPFGAKPHPYYASLALVAFTAGAPLLVRDWRDPQARSRKREDRRSKRWAKSKRKAGMDSA